MLRILKHIILIGFKHVGKSTIGKALSIQLKIPFIDLDHEIENLYKVKFKQSLSCREIIQSDDENFFRDLEDEALSKIISREPSVLSIGGGTPIRKKNQDAIKNHHIIYLTASRGIVFERIQMSGRPEFFTPNENILESFNQLWDEREPIYERIKSFSIENNGSVNDAVNKIILRLTQELT